MASRTVSRLLPLFDRVVVRRAAQQLKTKSGILLPENANKVNEGVVVAVGPGRRLESGKFAPMSVATGDRVLLPEYGGAPLKLNDEDLTIYKENDLVGIIKDQ